MFPKTSFESPPYTLFFTIYTFFAINATSNTFFHCAHFLHYTLFQKTSLRFIRSRSERAVSPAIFRIIHLFEHIFILCTFFAFCTISKKTYMLCIFSRTFFLLYKNSLHSHSKHHSSSEPVQE